MALMDLEIACGRQWFVDRGLWVAVCGLHRTVRRSKSNVELGSDRASI
ncbi:hypothetical protein [Zarconia navalis]|nr:hypothetical protein [Zarconia navalis]